MASGIIQITGTLGAGLQNDDIFINQILAFNRQGASAVRWAVTSSAAGLLIAIFTGVIQQAPEFAVSTANRFPIDPDDYGGVFGALPADRIIGRLRNTSGGTLTYWATLKFSNVSGR